MTADLAERAIDRGRLAIDTEFVSERRYQAQLCLVQVAVPDPDAADSVRTEVLDPLDGDAPLDHGPLARALADPAVEVVMHAGRQDVAILKRTWQTDVTNVFDTQVAAGFLGYGNQEGYEQLVRRVLGERLGGGEGFTRWDRRPLTDRQLAYAADDARCLLALGEAVTTQLDERGRLGWAREESRLLEAVTDDRSPERAYERLPRLGRLDARGRAIARRLCEWREGLARQMDRPPAYVVPDQALIELARRAPRDKTALENIRGLPQQTLHRRGGELLSQIAQGREEEPPPPPPAPPKREVGEAPLVPLAQALVRHRSQESGVASELIATQAELSALVAGLKGRGDASGIRVLSGWREELVGRELRDLVEGRLSISVGPDGRLDLAPVTR